MKNFTQTIVLIIATSTIMSAINNPIEVATLISHADVEVTVDESISSKFILAQYNSGNKSIEFAVKSNINYIQIYNAAGDLQYQLPVLSSKVKISKSLFSQLGDYKLGFKLDGIEDVQFSTVKIK